MEGTASGGRSAGLSVRTKRDVIIEVWNRLQRAAVGENQLREIQHTIAKQFGAGAVESPAAIARLRRPVDPAA